jgi:flagellar protein FliL
VASKKEGAARTSRGKTWLFPVLISVVATAMIGGGTAWYLVGRAPAGTGAEGAAAAVQVPKGPAQYVGIEPAFVVNLADEGELRYLQVEIQVMTRDPKIADELKTHMPMIRNRLLLLFSQQRVAELRSREDKERLQAAALQEVQDVLTSETGRPGIETLLFTSFVTQ